MKMAHLRKTGQEVSKAAVEGLWKKLHELWTKSPLAFVEFVRHSRKRSHKIHDRATLSILLHLELIDQGRDGDFPVHDAYRELVSACVEGDGLAMMLHRPFAGDDSAVSKTVTLQSGVPATQHIVDDIVRYLESLCENDYIAFAELVRHVRDDKHPMKLFGGAMSRLLAGGVAHLEMRGTNTQKAVHGLFEALLGGTLLVDGPVKFVVNDLAAALIPEAVTGNHGLNFRLRNPVKEKGPAKTTARPSAKSSPSSNGHAHKDEVPAGTH